jgi:hypothetical protein
VEKWMAKGRVHHPFHEFDLEWWSREFENYLVNLKSRMINVPLYYVTREETDKEGEISDVMERINPVQLDGQNYAKDNQKVYQLIKSLLLETEGWNLIRRHVKRQDGRSAMQALRDHYDSRAAKQTRISQANCTIDNLEWHEETGRTADSFEQFRMKLHAAFETLQENGQPKIEEYKVWIFHKKIKAKHGAIIAAKAELLKGYDHRAGSEYIQDFALAMDRMKRIVDEYLPMEGQGSRRRVADIRRLDSGRGRGRGRGRLPRYPDTPNRLPLLLPRVLSVLVLIVEVSSALPSSAWAFVCDAAPTPRCCANSFCWLCRFDSCICCLINSGNFNHSSRV